MVTGIDLSLETVGYETRAYLEAIMAVHGIIIFKGQGGDKKYFTAKEQLNAVGQFGTHRIFSPLGRIYGVLIGTFEILALLVFISVIIFWLRRNMLRIKRFMSNELIGWPKKDANLILYFEILLMGLFIIMNATDVEFQEMNSGNLVSSYVAPLFDGFPKNIIERVAWWLHIIGILIFLNYLFYSKHLHIILAFPNTYYGSLRPKVI